MGGAERVATNLCNAWVARGDKVALILTSLRSNASFYPVSPSVELIYLNTSLQTQVKKRFEYFNKILAIRKLIKNKKPDVIISFLANVNITAIIATRFLNIPVICFERRNPQFKFSWILESLCKITYPFANALLIQTNGALALMQKMHPYSKMIRVIPNPIADGLISIQKQWLPKSRKVLLSIGRLAPEKQIDKTIKAFHALASTYLDWDLHIYGQGPMHDLLVTLVAELKLQGRVFIKPALDNPWSKITNEADIFISTSNSEGFPNTLLEAMAVGLPCIVFDCCFGPRDASNNGQFAKLIPVNDMLTLQNNLSELMEDEQLRINLGSAARTYVITEYSMQKIMGRWDEIIKECGI